MARTSKSTTEHDGPAAPIVLLDNVHKWGEVYAKGTLLDDLPAEVAALVTQDPNLVGPLDALED